MKAILKKPYKVNISRCDNTRKLSIPHIFSVFMDLAAEHAGEIGLGLDFLREKDLFWVTVKTKIHIFERPVMFDDIVASTWPEAPGRIRCNRYYTLTSGENLLACGKTEWAIISTVSGLPCKLSNIYPNDIDHSEEKVCDGAFSTISDDFSDGEIIGTYTVRSSDIDLGQHMNNSAYAHALFSMFSCKEIEEMNVQEVEIAFRSSSYEGETLTVCRRKTDNGAEYGFLHSDGKPSILAKIL